MGAAIGGWGFTNKALNGTCNLNDYGFAYYNANWTDYVGASAISLSLKQRLGRRALWSRELGHRCALRCLDLPGKFPLDTDWDCRWHGDIANHQIQNVDWIHYVAQNLIRLTNARAPTGIT